MKNKFSSFVNIFGLAVGLTCCMLISLYLYREFSYDSYHKKSDRIYQLATSMSRGEKEIKTAFTPSVVAPAVQKEFPEVEASTRLVSLQTDDKTLLQYTAPGGSPQSFFESNGFMADSNFFDLFDYDFIEGNTHRALMNPNSLVISEEIAHKIFGAQPAINKIIHISSNNSGDADYTVTGVFRPRPEPSHIKAGFFLSLSSGDMGQFVRENTNFANNNFFLTYLLLKPGADAAALQAKMPAFVDKYMARDLAVAGSRKEQHLIALKDIYLRSEFSLKFIGQGNLSYLYILGSVAIFILIIACINFMNLATARSAKRAAEVGIRKVLGAEKTQLIRQFLGEAILLSFFAFLLAFAMLQLLLPFFSTVTNADLSLSINRHASLIGGFVVLAIVTGLIAGFYPAFYLSAFRPIKVLKGRFSNSLSAVTLRKSLVILQFAVSAVLIIACFVIGRQTSFMRKMDLGFAKDQQIVIPLRSQAARDMYAALKSELRANTAIQSVGGSAYYPGIFNASDLTFFAPGKTVEDGINIKLNYVDKTMLQTLEIKPVAGRLFTDEFPADTNQRLILNETAVSKLGFASPQAAVGQRLTFPWQDTTYTFEVVGVVRDFNFEGLKQAIQPFGFRTRNANFNYLIVHSRGGDPGSLLSSLETAWKKLNPNEQFEYSFLDDDFQKNHESEQRLFMLIRYFMIIAIVISCLGLLGLVVFSAEQRTREIGIRKVLGSSVSGIVALLSKEFLLLVFIGNLIAIPLAWYILSKWVQEFAFRAELSWWLFVIAIVVSLTIAMITLSFQAIRAAVANPIKSLRTE